MIFFVSIEKLYGWYKEDNMEIVSSIIFRKSHISGQNDRVYKKYIKWWAYENKIYFILFLFLMSIIVVTYGSFYLGVAEI